MDRHAYLIMAYNNWDLLKKLLILLDDERNDIFVHIDENQSHYLKILLDEIFNEDNFVNEIVWAYKDIGSRSVDYFKRKHDILLFYQKSSQRKFNILR